MTPEQALRLLELTVEYQESKKSHENEWNLVGEFKPSGRPPERIAVDVAALFSGEN